MWNLLNLECPVDDRCEYNVKDDAVVLKDFSNLVTLLTKSAEVLTAENPIWTEIKVFQNVQAKYKRILHCDKCLQLLQRVGSCLRKMVILNLSQSYLNLAENLLSGLNSKTPTKKNAKIFLPSRQQLEYVLLRTQSAAKLICEALHYSTETFCYLLQRLNVGHTILNLMMATSVTARVNILFKGILVQIMDFYRTVYTWRDKLKIGAWKWSQPIDLPEDLEKWLTPEESDLLKSKQVPLKDLKFLTNFVEKQRNKSQSDTDSVINLGSEDENECSIVADVSQQSESMDVGEVISRTDENDNVPNLTEAQERLLKKIMEAKSFKKLRNIWCNIDDWIAEGAIPRSLTRVKIIKIDKMFAVLRKRLNEVKNIRLTDEERKKQNNHIKDVYRLKFSRLLRLLPKTTESSADSSAESLNQSFENLKPVKSFKELLKLYNNLYILLESANENKKCIKLKKMFKSRKADIQLLIDNKEGELAKQLIFCTSKILLTKYRL